MVDVREYSWRYEKYKQYSLWIGNGQLSGCVGILSYNDLGCFWFCNLTLNSHHVTLNTTWYDPEVAKAEILEALS